MIIYQKPMKWIMVWISILIFFLSLNFDYFHIVLYPVNLKYELEMAMKFADRNFERPTFKVNCKIERMSFKIDPKQLSDLLDFVKFQNYSVFYGRIISIYSFY